MIVSRGLGIDTDTYAPIVTMCYGRNTTLINPFEFLTVDISFLTRDLRIEARS